MVVLSTPKSIKTFIKLDISAERLYDAVTREVAARVERLFEIRLKEFQLLGIDTLLKQQDLMVEAGTNSGKSILYLSMATQGIVLVVSPLLSLMDDQVRQLVSHMRVNVCRLSN
jgi:superfamily II DNA helicase RecQ